MTEPTLAAGIDLLQQRTKIPKILLVAGMILIVAVFAGQIAEFNGLFSLAPDAPVTEAAAFYLVAVLADALLTLITYILFGIWIYRAAANVRAAAVPGFTFTPSWAVGWYFVPIANLFQPYQAMRQIWNTSHGGDKDELYRGHSLLAAWWGAWLFTAAVGTMSYIASASPDSPGEFREGQILGMIYSGASLILYPLAIELVHRVAEGQRRRLTAAHIFA